MGMLSLRSNSVLLRVAGLLGSVLTLVAAPAVMASPDALDSSFGQGGSAIVQANAVCRSHACAEFGGSYAEAVAVEPDGQIVLGGSNNYVGSGMSVTGEASGALVGLDASGALDSSFGGGVVSMPFAVAHLYVAADGVIALGSAGGNIEAEQYSNSGVLDSSFGTGGLLSIPVPAGLIGLTEGRDGRILALSGGNEGEITVRRYLASGQPDSSFGNGGTVRLQRVVTPIAFASLPNGGVVIVGGTAVGRSSRLGVQKLVIARLNPSGGVSSSFGVHGMASLSLPHPKGVILTGTPNGHVLLAATESAKERLSESTLVLADFTNAGRLDRTFGRDGIARSVFPSSPREGLDPKAIAIDSDGDPVVVGERPITTVDVPEGVGFIARYTGRGKDCSFGNDGVVINPGLGGANALAFQANGRLVIAGWTQKEFAAVRYIGGGQPRTCRGEG